MNGRRHRTAGWPRAGWDTGEVTELLSSPRRDVLQPVLAGIVASIVGFAGSFAIVLAGLRAVGASPDQAASGLLALSLAMGLTGVALSWRLRMPISVAWSTPGAALLVSAGAVHGGWPAAVGAFAAGGLLVVLAAVWRPLAAAIAGIPAPLANALLAGVLLSVCLAPARSLIARPALTAPVIVTWLVLLRVARRWSVPGALAAAAIGVALDPLHGTQHTHLLPALTLTMPLLDFRTLIGVGLPLFIVTMASQNVAGLSVLRSYGYDPHFGRVLGTTGVASVVVAPFGGHAINLAAVTAALAAGPVAHPDPARRWIAAASGGAMYVVLGLAAGLATVLLAASPPVLIEAVAGLALLGALGGALAAATADRAQLDTAMVTFVVTVSGFTVAGISAPFWGLVAGLALRAVTRKTAQR